MMTFHLRLKKISQPKHTRLKFNLEKLKDPNVLETFQAKIGGKFAPLIITSNKDTDIYLMITSFNTAVTETIAEIFGGKKPGSLQILIYATKGENWEKKSNLKIWEIRGSEQEHQEVHE